MELFKLPRDLGEYEGKVMSVGVGRFGAYVKHDGKYVSLKKTDDPLEITPERAIELIGEKRQKDVENTLVVFDNDPDLKVMNGRFGPYISYKKKNYRLSKDVDPKTLTYDACLALVENEPKAAPKRKKSEAKR